MLCVKRIELLGFNPIIIVRYELGGDRPGFKYTHTYQCRATSPRVHDRRTDGSRLPEYREPPSERDGISVRCD